MAPSPPDIPNQTRKNKIKNMFAKKINNHLNPCCFLFHGYKILLVALLALGMAACSNQLEETEPEPTSTFKIHIGESNIVQMDLGAPDYYPPTYQVVLVMENLPADEKIIYLGACYSSVNKVPDINDYTHILDYSTYEPIQDWNWSEPLYWTCARLSYLLPNKTYYLRGYVQTNKGTYYSNTMTLRSSSNASIVENPDAYEIPVIFHLFPDSAGNYLIKDQAIQEQIEYANYVYSNSFRIPGQTETGVRFVAATQAPDGTPLSTPGIIHETQPITIDYFYPKVPHQYVWDMEQVLNVWVAPFVLETSDTGNTSPEITTGVSYFPYFDEDEKLEGCPATYQPGIDTGIFLNSAALSYANAITAFAHETGHFLGLYHIFEPEDDYCSDTPWYDRTAYLQNTYDDMDYSRQDGHTGAYFWSDNVMDYNYGFSTGFTPDQVKRIQYTLQHAYFIPGEAGKEEPAGRSTGQARHFGSHPIH